MIACIVPDCSRARRLSPSGAVYAMCDAHTCSALTDAFGSEQSWHDRARAHTLPTSITGGSDRQSSAADVPPVSGGAALDADFADWAPGEVQEAFGR